MVELRARYVAAGITVPDQSFTGLLVDSAGNLKVTSGGSGATADQIQGGVAAGAADSGNPVKIGGVYSDNITAANTGQRVDASYTRRGSASVLPTYVTATAADAKGNTQTGWPTASNDPVDEGGVLLLPVNGTYNFNGTSWDREVKPNAASRIASAAATVNATSAKATAGNVYKVFGNNVKASVVYLKIYNKATAPTVGTDTPVLTIPIAASGRFDIDIGGTTGFYLGTGIAYGFTTDAADNGTTALAAGDILGFTMTYA